MGKSAIDMNEFQASLANNGVIFFYSGYMSEQILVSIGDAVKRKLCMEGISNRDLRSLFSIFVEQVQNVIRYSADYIPDETDQTKDSAYRYGIIMVGGNSEQYYVSCGNKIDANNVSPLKSKLTQLQSLDKEGLKQLHKKTLRGEVPEGSKGAGVGFIDMARRSSNGIEFDFRDIDTEHAFFTFKAYV